MTPGAQRHRPHDPTEHDHIHGDGCGHRAVSYDDHLDYIHDGHLARPARRALRPNAPIWTADNQPDPASATTTRPVRDRPCLRGIACAVTILTDMSGVGT